MPLNRDIQNYDASHQVRIDVSNYNVIRTLTIHGELGRGGRDSSKLRKTFRDRSWVSPVPTSNRFNLADIETPKRRIHEGTENICMCLDPINVFAAGDSSDVRPRSRRLGRSQRY